MQNLEEKVANAKIVEKKQINRS